MDDLAMDAWQKGSIREWAERPSCMYNVWAVTQAITILVRRTGKEEGGVEFNLFLDFVPPGGLLDGIGLQGSPMSQIIRAAPQVDAVEFDEPTVWIVLVEAKENRGGVSPRE
jgi:hypothetical protein